MTTILPSGTRRHWTSTPAERFLGLLRHDGSPKPAASTFRSGGGMTEAETDQATGWLDIREGEFLQDPRTHLPRLYRRFRDRSL